MNVFLVEDSVRIREKIRGTVTDAGGTVIGESAAEFAAIRDIDALHPDLVVLDLMLEEGNGINVIRKLRATQPTLPVIVLTSCTRETYGERCLAAGANWFLEKDSDYATFEALLRQLSATTHEI